MWPGLAVPGAGPVPKRPLRKASSSNAVQSLGCWLSACWPAMATPQ